ncbi:MAG: Gfo/Idh/MocA family oxidoreductase, partial [Acidobacteria bacterium]|nr:Gfo/Idh/MocA family oxidoreductase [Acidobacteriota bacterium]
MSARVEAAPPAPLRVALIGCGKMGLHHLKAIAATRRAVVVGVADPNPPDELRDVLPPSAIVVPSAAELFASASPDVVHIVTPPATHAALAIQALEAGCHVYVEKPFTLHKAEAAQVLDEARARNLQVCAGHQVLFEPPSLAIRDSLAAIGTVVHVYSYFSFRMVRRTITRVDQVKDILPHAVYPVVEHLRLAVPDAQAPLTITGLTVDASGDVYAIVRLGNATGVIVVTLNGRPVEQYHQVVGTNGSVCADGSAGAIRLAGQGAGPGALITPFRRVGQTLRGATKAVAARFLSGGYPGLSELFGRFYDSIRLGTTPPLAPQSILDTVDICEQIGDVLDEAEHAQEQTAADTLAAAERALPVLPANAQGVLVTGGTGMLGRAVAEELRDAGYRVRVVARRVPPASMRLPGIDYVGGNLAAGLDASHMS